MSRVTKKQPHPAPTPPAGEGERTLEEPREHDENRARALVRLRRIEGQVRGLQRMLESDRYCVDVLHQIDSVQEALRGVSRELLRDHLTHCASRAISEGGAARTEMIEELVELSMRRG